MTLTKERVKRLLAKATPGPWQWFGGIYGYIGEGKSESRSLVLHGRSDAAAANRQLVEAAPALASTCLALFEENERLRKALEPFAREANEWPTDTDDSVIAGDYDCITVGDLRNARAALQPPKTATS